MRPGTEKIVHVGQAKEMAHIAQFKHIQAWYVSRRYNTGNYKDIQYLHGDGVWREQTIHEGQYSGHFMSIDECEAAIRRYESKESPSSLNQLAKMVEGVEKKKSNRPGV